MKRPPFESPETGRSVFLCAADGALRLQVTDLPAEEKLDLALDLIRVLGAALDALYAVGKERGIFGDPQ